MWAKRTVSGERWYRDVWTEAVWSSGLPSSQRLVAFAYADHARDGDTAWLASARLCARTGLGRTAAAEAVRRLARGGWLVPVDRPGKGHTTTYRLAVPAPEKDASRPTQKDASRASEQAQGRLTTREGRLATREGRQPTPTAVPISVLTSSLPVSTEQATEASALRRETTSSDEDTFGGRALAALAAQGRHDHSAAQLQAAFAKASSRVGLPLAADAVLAVAALPNLRSLTGFVAGTDADELRRLAEEHREQRERPARPAKPSAPSKCDDARCGPTRRLEDDDGRDLGRCPRCHPGAARRHNVA